MIIINEAQAKRFRVDNQDFLFQEIKNHFYIRPIHPYDEAEYYYAVDNFDEVDEHVWAIYYKGKKVSSDYFDDEKSVARMLNRLNKGIKPKISNW